MQSGPLSMRIVHFVAIFTLPAAGAIVHLDVSLRLVEPLLGRAHRTCRPPPQLSIPRNLLAGRPVFVRLLAPTTTVLPHLAPPCSASTAERPTFGFARSTPPLHTSPILSAPRTPRSVKQASFAVCSAPFSPAFYCEWE